MVCWVTYACVTYWWDNNSRAKCRVHWESIVVREKWDNVKKKHPFLMKRNPTNANAQKLETTNTYQKEQIEYILRQIIKIRNVIEDRPSELA